MIPYKRKKTNKTSGFSMGQQGASVKNVWTCLFNFNNLIKGVVKHTNYIETQFNLQPEVFLDDNW